MILVYYRLGRFGKLESRFRNRWLERRMGEITKNVKARRNTPARMNPEPIVHQIETVERF